MTYKDALNFVEFWLRELCHKGHTNVEEKTKILKLIRKEINMGLNAGFVSEDEKYNESGMAKLMGQRYPEMKMKDTESFTISSNKDENGLNEIGEFIRKNPDKVLLSDYYQWEKLDKYFSIRRADIPTFKIKSITINFPNNIIIEGRKFKLKTKED